MLARYGVFVAIVATMGCAAPRFAAVDRGAPRIDPPPVEIRCVPLGYSNMYLLRHAGAVALVDAGSAADVDAATAALAAEGLRPSDVRVVVVTHGHGDHAGMGRFFQQSGAKIVLGRGDEAQTTAGHNDEMNATSPLAAIARPLFRLSYPPYQPDVVVDDELDLASFGFPSVRVRRMPGHTRGSVVVFAGPRDVFVGDEILGGLFGGVFHAETAEEHYYQLDERRNHCNVQSLLDSGYERFFLGHGGPVTRDAVLRWRKSWPKTRC